MFLVQKRPPKGNKKVGTVRWEETFDCFLGSNGYFWHGRLYGGWKTNPPETFTPLGNQHVGTIRWEKDRSCFVGSNGYYYWHGHGAHLDGWKTEPPPPPVVPPPRRNRQPNGNQKVGWIVTYNTQHFCYQSNKKYFWHGKRNGGWKLNPPSFSGCDGDKEDDRRHGCEIDDIQDSVASLETDQEEAHNDGCESESVVDSDDDLDATANPWQHRHVPKLFALPDSTPATEMSPEQEEGLPHPDSRSETEAMVEEDHEKSRRGSSSEVSATEDVIQLVRPGEGRDRMRLQNFISRHDCNKNNNNNNNNSSLSFHRPILVRDTPESIGMKIPKGGSAKYRRSSNTTTKQESMTMIASGKKRRRNAPGSSRKGDRLSVRDVANIVGHSCPVQMINVLNQKLEDDLADWTFYDLVEYFEDEQRLARNAIHQPPKSPGQKPSDETLKEEEALVQVYSAFTGRSRRKAAIRSEQCFGTMMHNRGLSGVESSRILNQISYEFSGTPLHAMVRSPALVREIDWIDHAWPAEKKLNENPKDAPAKSSSGNDASKKAHKGKRSAEYPVVQYYCLTSAAGSYTDFHIDFGGSSVWYHVVRGQKIFLVSPPTEEYLKIYEEWLCHSKQARIFLPDLMKKRACPDSHCSLSGSRATGCNSSSVGGIIDEIPFYRGSMKNALSTNHALRFTLDAGETLILPAGWIHAVYTPVDSLVFGGNFLHGFDMQMQLKVNALEARSNVLEKYRFPHFGALQMYAGGMYLQRLRGIRRNKPKSSVGSSKADASPAKTTKPPDSDTQLNDPLEGLSDLSKEYLASVHITTAEQFLLARTGDVAKNYPAWRKQKGMSEIKGTGHNAIVSMWKARVRVLAARMGATELVQLNVGQLAKIPGSEESYSYKQQKKPETLSPRELEELPMLIDDLEHWWKSTNYRTGKNPKEKKGNRKGERILNTQDLVMSQSTFRDAAGYVASKTGCKSVEDFLSALRNEHAKALDESNSKSNSSTRKSKKKKKRKNEKLLDETSSDEPKKKERKKKKGVSDIPGPPMDEKKKLDEYLFRRVAKTFDVVSDSSSESADGATIATSSPQIFLGTVEANVRDLWHIKYDDGDEEDLDRNELLKAFDLYENHKRLDGDGIVI